MTQRWKLTIEYDGTDFCGWQRQNNALAVQQVIEKAIFDYSGENAELTVAGRTDAGVHATGQVAHLDLSRADNAKTVRDAINFHLRPHPVSIVAVEPVAADFHARFHALKRVYCYKILMARPSPSVLDSRFIWHVWKDLDVEAMNTAAQHFLGTHDFSSFRDAECQAQSPIRSIDAISFRENPQGISNGRHIELWAEAKSFLHHQIRNFVGSLKMVGEGKWTPDDIKRILEARDRTQAGPTAPPQGLHFVRVEYPA